MRRVVICSPWRGDTELHHRYLLDCLRDCYARGEAPIAPHAIGPLVLDEEDPEQRRQGIEAGLAWLEMADVLAVYTDLAPPSEGMQAEIDFAAEHSILIDYRNLPAWRGRRAG